MSVSVILCQDYSKISEIFSHGLLAPLIIVFRKADRRGLIAIIALEGGDFSKIPMTHPNVRRLSLSWSSEMR